MPGEQQLHNTFSSLLSGFSGVDEIWVLIKSTEPHHFNVRPKVIFNEAEKYINKIACSNYEEIVMVG